MDDGPDFELAWWDRLMCLNRFTLWVGTHFGLAWVKARWAYSDLMVKYWPYERWPNEWRSLWGKR